MAGLNNIAHKNPLIQKKVNFFVDYFEMVLRHSGMLSEWELENPLSIVDKIITQVERNKPRCVPFLDHYLHKEQWANADYFDIYKTHAEFVVQMEAYRKLPKKVNKKLIWLQDASAFLKALKDFRRELKAKMFRRSLDAVIHFLQCTHELNEHKNAIIFHTHIITSELIFTRKNKEDAADVINRIFAKEFYLFPYPRHCKTIEQKNRYFQRKKFTTMFLGIERFYRESRRKSFLIFKIDGVKFPSDYQLDYNGVTIYSSDHDKLKQIKKLLKGDNAFMFREWFKNKSFAFAVIPAAYYNLYMARLQAVKQVTSVVTFMSEVLNEHLTFHPGNHFHTRDFQLFGHVFSRIVSGITLNEFDKQRLLENPFHILRNVSGPAARHMRHFETLYVSAKNTRNLNEYWRYLEIFLGKEKAQNKFAGILLLTEINYREGQLTNYLHAAVLPTNSGAVNLGITSEQQMDLVREKFSVEKAAEIITSEVFQLGATLTYKQLYEKEYAQLLYYYTGLLNELYEQRNMIEHAGILNERAAVKLDYTVDHLFARFRWTLYEYIQKYPGDSVKKLIVRIEQDVTKLLPKTPATH